MTNTSDETFVEEKEKQASIINDTFDDTETDPSEYGYLSDINGKYEPIYKDLTRPPVLDTSSYETILSYSLLEKFEDVQKINEGFIYNKNEPYPVDEKINQLEQHNPRAVFSSSEISGVRSMSACLESSHKINEVISLLDLLSKRVEKRLVQLDNIHAVTMRYLYRLSSRVNINCVYYGGQSIYNKYSCIRCLDDNLINDTPVTLDQCLNCTRYEPVIGQVYDIDDKDSDAVLHSSLMYDDMQMSRLNNTNIIDNLQVHKYRSEPMTYLGELGKPSPEKGDSESVITWDETSLDDQRPHIVDYDSGIEYDYGEDVPSDIWKKELAADEMLNAFENSSYLSEYKTKKDTMLAIGRVLADSSYHPVFIIGMMGHIQGEGNVGLFEKIHTGTWYFNAMKEHCTNRGETYYDYYQRSFSNQYIYDNMGLYAVKKLVDELLNIKYTDSSGSRRSLGFGLGCLQWTFERTQKLVNIYLDAAGKSDTITQDQAYQVEAQMINSELKGAYKNVYTHWYDSNNNKFSADAAYQAGHDALIGYGLNPVYLTTKLPSSLSVWNNVANTRGNNAKKLYNAIAKEIN